MRGTKEKLLTLLTPSVEVDPKRGASQDAGAVGPKAGKPLNGERAVSKWRSNGEWQ